MKFDDYEIQIGIKQTAVTKPTKAPFGYYGAKQRIAKKIIELLPPHNAWVEGFCGSAALTLAKPPSPIEVINDADGEIVNLFKQLRDNFGELYRLISLTPYSKEEYEEAKFSDSKELNGLERARRFLICTMMTVNSTYGSSHCGFSFSDSYARENKEARVNRWYNLPTRIESVVERLRGVRIENRDACKLVNRFSNRPATLMYLDPPYFVKRGFKYVIDANNVDFHTTLLENCRKSKCMILLSAYENELYSDMLDLKKGWHKHLIKTTTRDTSGKNYSRTEVLWMNKQFIKAKNTGRVPILLSKKEKLNNKINPIRKYSR